MEEKKEKMTLKEAIGPEVDVSQILPGKLEEARPRIAATVDEKVDAEIKRIHEIEKESAQKEDRPEPKLSHTTEMLLRKGIKAYKSERKTE